MNSSLQSSFTILATVGLLQAQEGPCLPHFRGEVSYSEGRLEHRSGEAYFDGKADASFGRIQLEGFADMGLGGGLKLHRSESLDDLAAPAGPGDVEAERSSWFLHASYLLLDSRFRLPIRLGWLHHDLELRHRLSGDTATCECAGIQLELEPELLLVAEGRFQCSLFGNFGLARTKATSEVHGIDFLSGDVHSHAWFGGFEVGSRISWNHCGIGMSYLWQRQSIEDGVIDDSEVDFEGILFTVGVVF